MYTFMQMRKNIYIAINNNKITNVMLHKVGLNVKS